jgi:membrane-bound serine protease (ClpP class)
VLVLLFSGSALAEKFVYVMKLKADFIGPPTVSQVDKIISLAEGDGAAAAMIMLDTPGGRVDSMFEIIERIFNSEVPVIIFVAPKGANAASAGAFITVASHIAAMAPGTAIGAAEPISGYDPQSGAVQPVPNKTKSFIIGKMESTTEYTGRPTDLCVRFITENLVLTPSEALEMDVIDFAAGDEFELLSQIEGFEIHAALANGTKVTVSLSDAEVRYVELSLSERFTNYMSNPSLAYILLMVGMYGLIFGFMSPGTYVPETLGAICIVLALFGMGIVGASIVGIILIAFGMIFLVAEAATSTFGLFTTAAVVCLIFGVLFIPPQWGEGGGIVPDFYMPREWYRTFTLTALAIIAAFAAFFVLGMRYVLKVRKRPPRSGGDELMGLTGTAVSTLDPSGQVRVRGEIWTARVGEGEIPAKDEVRVVGRKGLTLLVERTEGPRESG